MTLDLPPLPPSFQDRKTGLVVFGILELLAAAFCFLSVIGSLLGPLVARATGNTAALTEPRFIIPAVATMGTATLALAWLGIGSIQARRWARTLSLCLGWIGLVCGLFACVTLVWTLGAIDIAMRQASAQAGQALPTVVLIIAKATAAVVTLVIYVLIPAALVLFYGRNDVRLTCEARDPVPRWTDRCPVPVLAVVILQAFAAVSVVINLPGYGRVLPLFGLLVEGGAARMMYILFGAASLYLAWGLYRLRASALWTCLVLDVIFGASTTVTFLRIDLFRFYEVAGIPDAQLKILNQMPMTHSHGIIWLSATALLLFLGYLLWLKRYFVTAGVDGVASA